ncbi:MAG: ubiquinone/menaquinone biosynthesis C-methylase UbiE [Arenicella sp.]|jgi:ubiquinone/menaquinone biosynthesis C-methylase UbiE
MIDNNEKLKQELEIYDNNINIHDLPEIYHYWSNKHLKPILSQHNISHPDDLYVNHMFASACLVEKDEPIFISIGSGNCDTEVRIAKRLKEMGLDRFRLECLDLNKNMLARGREMAISENVEENMSFIEMDFNHWKADKEYVAVMANQSLHHIQNLESVFFEIKRSLHKDGAFITSDMVGRNGHQRWPEALELVHHFWQELPESYTYNHLLNRSEGLYENWDCSTEGFEGIRAQDILPLLVKEFHFEMFIGFSNVIDIFVDRCFGHNFDANKRWDTDFIDSVQDCDEKAILSGAIKPAHIMAVMKKTPVIRPTYSRGLSPGFCIRNPAS